MLLMQLGTPVQPLGLRDSITSVTCGMNKLRVSAGQKFADERLHAPEITVVYVCHKANSYKMHLVSQYSQQDALP